jgi:hypothetical protein
MVNQQMMPKRQLMVESKCHTDHNICPIIKCCIYQFSLVLANMLEDNPIDEYEITFPPKDSKLMTHRYIFAIQYCN